MVTFVCEYCDTTLKKKQCEGHIRGACRPGSLICIDCSDTFRGTDFKKHVSCISEQEKHWGDYAKVKKTKIIAKEQKPIQHQKESAPAKQQSIKNVEVPIEEQKNIQNQWKGWKNQLKSILKLNNGKIQKSELIKKAKALYEQKDGTQEITDSLIEQKIKKLKKVQEITYVILE